MPANVTAVTTLKVSSKPSTATGNSSSDSCDENQNTAECPHINKSVDLQKVRRVILKTSNNGESVGFATECEACKKNPTNSTNETEMNGDYECDRSLWMCLK